MSARTRTALIMVVVMIGCLLIPGTVASADEPCGVQVARTAADEQPVAGSRPVLFVHGMGSSHRAWNDSGLPKAVTKISGVTAWTFDYAAASYEWVTDPRIGPKLAEAIACLAKITGRSVVVVAHSMGGLATQLAVSERSPEGLRISDHVAEVITVGTPFRGSKLLSLLQKGRNGAKLQPGLLVTSAAADAFLSSCAAKAKEADNTCDVLNAFESPVGRALQEDSKQIRALPRWPADLPVLPIGGDIQLGTGIKIWGVGVGSTQSLGDPVVALQSATAHAVDESRMKLRCPILKMVISLTNKCYHGNLPAHTEVRDAVIEVITKIQASYGGTILYTRQDPSSYRTDLFAKIGNRAPYRVETDVRGLDTVSPDGRRRAWTDWESGDSARLMISDLDGGNAREIATGANLHGLCNHPAWAPDSRRILFLAEPQTGTTDSRWASIDVATGAQTALPPIKDACDPVWSPDGKAIAWQTLPKPGASSIVITDANGRGSRTVPAIQGIEGPCGNAVVALSPEGQYAVVDATDPGRRACGDGAWRGIAGAGVLVDTRTGAEVRTELTAPIGAGVFLPDGELLVMPVGGSEFILLDERQRVAAQFPIGRSGGEIKVFAYVPN